MNHPCVEVLPAGGRPVISSAALLGRCRAPPPRRSRGVPPLPVSHGSQRRTSHSKKKIYLNCPHTKIIFKKKPRVEDPSRLRRGSRRHLNRPYTLGRRRGRPPGQPGGGGGAETDEVLKRKKIVKVL